jgi:hypothetical protein
MIELTLPSRLNDASAAWFIKQLHANVDSDDIVRFGFQRLNFASPFASLVVASAMKRFFNQRKAAGRASTHLAEGVVEGTRAEGASYLAEMGFFKLIGIEEGKRPGQARGSDTYVPIKELTRAQFARSPDGFHQSMEVEAKALSRVIFPREDGAFDAVKYSLFETIRNVFEHSEAKSCFVFAQSLPNLGRVAEIAVVDAGCGILETLSRVLPKGATADQSVREAIRPGVTSNATPDSQDPYQNTGFGLYVMSELAKRCSGEFVLWSSDVRLELNAASGLRTKAAPFHGTAVKVRVTPTEGTDFENILTAIRHDGDAIAGTAKRPKSKSRGDAGRTEPSEMNFAPLVFHDEPDSPSPATPTPAAALFSRLGDEPLAVPAQSMRAARAPRGSESALGPTRRPRPWDRAVLMAAAEEVADDIAFHTGEPREIVVPALMRAMDQEDAESSVEAHLVIGEGWSIDAKVSDVLDRLPFARSHAINEAVEAWIERFDIRPLYAVGETVLGGRVLEVFAREAMYLVVDGGGRPRKVAFEDVHTLEPKAS